MDAVTRSWNEWIAAIAVWGGVPMLFILSMLVAAAVGLLWAYWPLWWPSWRGSSKDRDPRDRIGRPRGWRLRLRWRLRWRRRRRARAEPAEGERLPDDQVPDLPAEVLALSADELAAAGRYAEAVRERLRAMLRSLIERDLLPSSPGWTVMELASAGGRGRPALAASFDAAARIFSEIWYGLRPATADDDAAMRGHAAAVAAAAVEPAPTGLAAAAAGRPH